MLALKHLFDERVRFPVGIGQLGGGAPGQSLSARRYPMILTFLRKWPDDKGVSFHFWIDNYCKNKPLAARNSRVRIEERVGSARTMKRG
jgi:hypothetical protein